MSKKRLEKLLCDLVNQGIKIERNKIEIFVPDQLELGRVDRRATDFLKDKVFKKLPSGWGGFQNRNGAWVISGRFGFFGF